MSHDYSENILVQESAGKLLHDELGWDVRFAYNKETFGKDGTFGRKDCKEILLTRYLHDALKRLNPWINDSQISEAQKLLENRLSTSSLMQVNEEKYSLIRDGIPVTVKKPDGQTESRKAAVIDFQDSDKNYFLAIKELKIHGDLHRRRTDIVGFVNGIPLLFVELKRHDVDVEDAYTGNYLDYLDTVPHLFYYNAFLMLSNGMEGTFARALPATRSFPFTICSSARTWARTTSRGSRKCLLRCLRKSRRKSPDWTTGRTSRRRKPQWTTLSATRSGRGFQNATTRRASPPAACGCMSTCICAMAARRDGAEKR